ncbi:MAG: ribosome maturation factor RimP [Clostridia bacterium]|nr:ribosome maturation factor RimP [Clostridia bacterium]
MANKTETIALEIGSSVAENMGVYIVDVSYRKSDGKNVLCFFIDKENGVGIDDCEAFSRAVEIKLDESDPIESEYSLEVSSPGADRQLRKEREFLYYIGREVDVKLYKALDGMKEFTGTLKAFADETAVIEKDGKEISVSIKEAAYIKLHFEF